MQCLRYGSTKFWYFSPGQRRCSRCRLTRKFGKTRWQQTHFSPFWKGRLLELFCLDVPAYRLRLQVPLDPKTVQRWYRILSETIWEKVEANALDGVIELDEALFGGRSYGKRDWGAVNNKHTVFGIYQRDGKVITFLNEPSKRALMGQFHSPLKAFAFWLQSPIRAKRFFRLSHEEFDSR